MKPVLETNIRPFESVRFRQNAQLVSKDQLPTRRQQSISHYRSKARQVHASANMQFIQDIRKAFDLQGFQGTDLSSQTDFYGTSSDTNWNPSSETAMYTLQRGEFEFRVASGDLEYIPALEMTIITSYPGVEFVYTGTPIYVPPQKGPEPPALNVTI